MLTDFKDKTSRHGYPILLSRLQPDISTFLGSLLHPLPRPAPPDAHFQPGHYAPWFLRDYWRRPTVTGYPISIEDVIFAFGIGGIAYGIYKVFFNISVAEGDQKPRAWLVIAFFLIILLPLLLFTNLLGINSIFSSTFSLLLIAVLTWILRPDLRKPSIVSGILVLVLFFLVYKAMQVIFPSAIEYWCMGCNPLGLRILGINIEELLWDFSWGLAGGTMVEAILGEKLQKR